MLSKSKSQTQKIAAKLAKQILLKTGVNRLRAIVIALYGNLGAGKTTFVQGFMKAFGVKQRVASPTFLIIRKYKISKSKFQINSKSLKPKAQSYFNVYHLDLYRIHKPKELLDLGFKKILKDPQNIVLIEWPERVKKILPKNMTWIVLEHGKKQSERIINVL